jgi:hypothetical protein
MAEYLVLWKIFVEADSPSEAAWEALAAQRNPESEATEFEVRDELGGLRMVSLGPYRTETTTVANAGRGVVIALRAHAGRRRL